MPATDSTPAVLSDAGEFACHSDYQRIARAIDFVVEHQAAQPSLAQIADHLQLSPAHLQRLFSRWAGISPKRFLQALTVARAKQLLDAQHSLLDTAEQLGLSSGSRLYDHFVSLEAVTPGEYKSGGEGLLIRYGCGATAYGEAFVAATPRGLCRLNFIDSQSSAEALLALRRDWPNAALREDAAWAQQSLGELFSAAPRPEQPLSLHVAGSNFQIAVWRLLLQIPPARLASYGQLAAALGKPAAARAVGSAVGANPVALLIPCHRVIQRSGALGGYRWGLTRKRALLAVEHAARES